MVKQAKENIGNELKKTVQINLCTNALKFLIFIDKLSSNNTEMFATMKKSILFIIIIFSNILLAETIGRVMKSNGTVLIKPMGSPSYSVSTSSSPHTPLFGGGYYSSIYCNNNIIDNNHSTTINANAN